MLFSVLPLATTLLYLGGARAANDWSVPCLTGQCSYDLQNSTASGSLQIVSISPLPITSVPTRPQYLVRIIEFHFGLNNRRRVDNT